MPKKSHIVRNERFKYRIERTYRHKGRQKCRGCYVVVVPGDVVIDTINDSGSEVVFHKDCWAKELTEIC